MDTIEFQHPQTPGLVSVVIPTRNGEQYIGAALESIADQTYKDWEVVVIEDGSHGETDSIVRRFAREHPTHRVHFQRNERSHGTAFTRNLCFGLAAGQWIAFLDCDDRWLPGHLTACVEALDDQDADVAYSAAAMCQNGTDRMLGFWGPTQPEIDTFPQSLLARSFVTPSATVCRRSVIEEVGPWNTACKHCEDADFFLRAAKLGKKFHCVGGVHCLYRKNHEGAVTHRLAGTIEEYATIASWFLDMPHCNPKTSTRMVAHSFAVAARMHARHAPSVDPSATASRAASLYLRAWKLRRGKIAYLLKAARYAMTKGVSPNPELPQNPTQASIRPAVRAAA